MKKWNAPEIEVLEINETANGWVPAFFETGRMFNDDITEAAVSVVTEIINSITSSDRGDDVTPNTEDRNSLDAGLTDRLS